MDAAGFLLIILLIAGLIVAIVLLNQKRTNALKAIAQQLKLQFSVGGDAAIRPLIANLEFFDRGQFSQARNILHGTVHRQGRECTVAIFDYFYTVGHGKNRDTLCQTVMVFYDDSLHLPAFNVRSEHFIDKINNLIGFEDVNFPQFPQFSKRYRLNTSNPDAVRSLFQPGLIKFYESQKIGTEANGSSILIFPAGNYNPRAHEISISSGRTNPDSRMLAPEEIPSFLEVSVRLLNLLAKSSQSK